MQTFLPYPSFAQSAQALDDVRLANQRNEATVLLNALRQGPRCLFDQSRPAGKRYLYGAPIELAPAGILVRPTPWFAHAAARMWRGFELALAAYRDAIVREWIARGKRNSVPFLDPPADAPRPPWLGDPAFHAAHRSALVAKDSAFYSRLWPDDPPGRPYVWPA